MCGGVCGGSRCYGFESLKCFIAWMKVSRDLLAMGFEGRKGMDSALRLSLQCRRWHSFW